MTTSGSDFSDHTSVHGSSLDGAGGLPPGNGRSGPLPRRRSSSLLAVLGGLVFSLTGCATGGAAATGGEAPGPGQAEPREATVQAVDTVRSVSAVLRPTDEMREVADTSELTGRELGTMWTFENPPTEYWADRYDFRPDSAWLAHARLASVRYGEICSASFVSPEGLVMTNHHCARDCVEAVSTQDTDYVEQGFYAETREDEKLCPGLHLDQLIEIEDVTRRVRSAVPEGASDEEAAEALEDERTAVEESCETGTDYTCQVVSLYRGGQYQLYKYRRFSPVKLVFAPELQAGFYGGDPDNFTYPRYNLDVSFVRAYRPDSASALEPEHWFEWDPEGAAEGELVFVTGNPGSTSRQSTVSQLLYERTYRHHFIVQLLTEQRDFLQAVADRGPEAARQVRDQLFSIENSLKAYGGQLDGLEDPGLMGRKLRWERTLREEVRADSAFTRRYADLWDRMARLQAEKLEVSPRLNANNFDFIGSPHMGLAGQLVRYLRASARPPAERGEEMTEERLGQLRGRLEGQVGLGTYQSTQLLAIRLRIARRWLPDDDPFLRDAFREEESPEEAATRLVGETRIGEQSFRRGLLQAGASALDTVSDPLVRLAAGMEARYRELQPRWDRITASEAAQEERLADALFDVYGTRFPPDATFTLRVTDGTVARYPYNGTFAPAQTSFYGLYARAAEFGGEMPWTLPHAFEGRAGDVDLGTALNFVSTNDITGGNSGSPVIDREGRVVGVAFDGNIQQLPNEFLFRTEQARTVSVHTAGITEALREIYGADRLLDELLGDRSGSGSGGGDDTGG